MNIILISQCEKRALAETRRILDQFAERKGERTWQTPITQAGLDTLRRLLRQTARKNTAVACHWVRGQNHTELLWIVGNKSRFNTQGTVPTNTTTRDILRTQDENDWHTGHDIRLLAQMAALLHDLGKASQAFQGRLWHSIKLGNAPANTGKNLIRHEWVSLRLFQAFVGQDDDATWLQRLADMQSSDESPWLNNLICDGMSPQHHPLPFQALSHAPLAQAIAWLMVTHHRLPQPPESSNGLRVSGLKTILNEVAAPWNEPAFSGAQQEDFESYWKFPLGLPVCHDAWRNRIVRIAKSLLARNQTIGASAPLNNPFVMHIARLCLMLADHYYSSQKSAQAGKHDDTTHVLANTCKDSGCTISNQTLDEHLLGVAQHSAEIAATLPKFEQYLPRLLARSGSMLKARATDGRYQWQNRAAEKAATLRDTSREHGAFIINMASTGCGKTIANARIMHALSDPQQGMRCAFALGLRTLTLQTGRAFQRQLHLNDDDLAILVGGSASCSLFAFHEQQAEASGSSSQQALLDEDCTFADDSTPEDHPLLRCALADPQIKKLLLSPLLVCTIDHLVPATESQRGGRQIAPMLRLLSGDLVLDEPDDFDLSDLPALTRLVHWAGMLGSRVLLSSATLPPDLVTGLFLAYLKGREIYQRNCGSLTNKSQSPPAIKCMWVDENDCTTATCENGNPFRTAHDAFAQKRYTWLQAQASKAPRRIVEMADIAISLSSVKSARGGAPQYPELAQALAPLAVQQMHRLHLAHATQDPHSNKRVSFGLVRMANIQPLFELALALYQQTLPADTRIHLCVYHSQHLLAVRSAMEATLDATLNRQQPLAVFDLPDIRARLDGSAETHHLFVVLGSPVTEVGRDHDYDWAVVEPSSLRSIIQLAGRVRRHRASGVTVPNIILWRHNLRHFKQSGGVAFEKPGFENRDNRLEPHDVQKLLKLEGGVVDARQRIVLNEHANSKKSLADLEHHRIKTTVLPKKTGEVYHLNASTWWHQPANATLLTYAVQQQQRFRKHTGEETVLALLPDENGEPPLQEHRIWQQTAISNALYLPCANSECTRLNDPLSNNPRWQSWATLKPEDVLEDLAHSLDLLPRRCAEKFLTVAVRGREEDRWRWHPMLGFARSN